MSVTDVIVARIGSSSPGMWRSDGYAAELLSVVDGMLALSTIQDKQICLLLEQRWVVVFDFFLEKYDGEWSVE